MFDNNSVKNAVTLTEAVKTATQFATNAGPAATVGIQDDKSKSVINNVVAGSDPLIARLVNNNVANAAEYHIDPCLTGKEKYYIQKPYIMSDTAVGADDDGTGCCVGTPTVTDCRDRLGVDELCVKDCVDSSLDEMMEEAVRQQAIDTRMPWSRVGATFSAKRAEFLAIYTKFIFERNAILGTQDYSGNGLRPFAGLVDRLLDNRVIKFDGSAGFVSSVETLQCRLTAMGDYGTYIAAVNPIAMRSLLLEVRSYLKTNPLSEWRLNGNTVSYANITFVESYYVDIDLATNTTSMWLIDTSKVGIKFLYPITRPYIKRIESTDDCGGHCLTMHNAGTTVVTDWNALMQVKNISLAATCDSTALTGLDDFVNPKSSGHLYPGVTANPSL